MFRKRRWLLAAVVGIAVVALASGLYAWREYERRDLDAGVKRALSDALSEQASLEAARAMLVRLKDRPDRVGETRLLDAAVLLRTGNPLGALQTLERVTVRQEHDVPAALLTGAALMGIGKLADAIETFRGITRVHPDVAEAHRGLAFAYRQLGALQASVTELEHVIRLEPDRYQGYWMLGSTYADEVKHYPKATKFLRLALERNPEEPHRTSIRRDLAKSALLASNYAEAVQVLESEHTEALDQLMLAEAYWKLGKREEAERLVTDVDRSQPDLHGALMLGAVMAIERGDARAALPGLKKILERDPHDMVARHQLSMAYHSLGDSEASKAEANRMLASRALYRRSDELRKEAIERPTDLKVRQELADVCERLGNNAEAARWRESAERLRQIDRPPVNRAGPPS